MKIFKLAKFLKSKKFLYNGNISFKKNNSSLTYISQFNYSKQQKQNFQLKSSFSDIMQEVEIYRDQILQAKTQNDLIITTQEIVRCLFKYDYNSIFDQKEDFRVLIFEVIGMFENYLSTYPFSPSIIRLDNNILKPLIDQKYVSFVEKYSFEENEKKLYSTKLKSIGFLCEILQSEINSMNIERMHELMNEYLDQYELEIIYSRQFEEFDQNEFLLKGQMELSNFYFLVARIFLEQNQIDEFERFILMGIEETINSYDYLLDNLKNQKNDDLDWILGVLTAYPPKLLSLYELFKPMMNQQSQKQFLINYCNKVKLLSDKIWNVSINEETLNWKLQLAIEFSSLEQFEEAFYILKFIYNERHRIQDSQIMYNLLLFLSLCKEKINDQTFNQIELWQEMANLKCIDQAKIIGFQISTEIQKFNILIQNKQFLTLQEPIEKIVSLFDQHCEFILQKKTEAVLNIFEFIDSLMLIEEIPYKYIHLSSLYQSLKRLRNFQLIIEKQDYEKYFYLLVLYFYDCLHQKKDPQDIINQFKYYFSKYECHSDYKYDIYQKALNLNQILQFYNYKQIQVELIELIINNLKKQNLDQQNEELLQLFLLKKQNLGIELQRKK